MMFIRKMVAKKRMINKLLQILMHAWDPEFVKITPSERKAMNHSEREIQNGIYFREEDVWK